MEAGEVWPLSGGEERGWGWGEVDVVGEVGGRVSVGNSDVVTVGRTRVGMARVELSEVERGAEEEEEEEEVEEEEEEEAEGVECAGAAPDFFARVVWGG